MKTINEIKIETLKHELEKEIHSLAKYKASIEVLVKELVHYEVGKKQRDEELTEMKNNMITLKNSITDFNQETFEKYIQYHDIQNEYERLSKYYTEFDQKLERMKEEISSKEDSINYITQRIENIKDELKNTESEI